MRTPREYYPKKPIVYTFELSTCPECHAPLNIAYTSGAKTVQTYNRAQSTYSIASKKGIGSK
jgi:hypothetical protein